MCDLLCAIILYMGFLISKLIYISKLITSQPFVIVAFHAHKICPKRPFRYRLRAWCYFMIYYLCIDIYKISL